MEDGNFMEFIYSSSFMISVNFPDQLVIDIVDQFLYRDQISSILTQGLLPNPQ